jgi:dimethylglycine dehydrogenase
VTSGGYGHFVERSLALGLVPAELIEHGARFEIEILGDMRPAVLATRPLFDPDGERMRG